VKGQRVLWAIFLGALLVRAGFAWWAPGIPTGDDLWHHGRAVGIAHGAGYVDLDGSPSVAWMPGWSLWLGGLYALFGVHPTLGLASNVLCGAVTAALVASIGGRLLSPVAGGAAGVLYALWPGNVYYAATLMSEPAFNAALTLCLWLLVVGTSGDRPHPGRWIVAAGVAFGGMAWLKAEPWVLLPLLLGGIALGPWSARRSAGLTAAFTLAAALVISPWVVRNYVHFGSILVTSGTGPANAWLGHHEGASGGQSLATANAQARYLREHPQVSGYRLAWEFAKEHPGEELALAWRKLVLTYGGDDDAVTLIRGVRPRERRHLSLPAELALRRIADGYWYAVLALGVVGVAGWRRWPATHSSHNPLPGHAAGRLPLNSVCSGDRYDPAIAPARHGL
jgi:hypothetical protein